MTARVKLLSIETDETDWTGLAVTTVAKKVKLVLELSAYEDLKGGTLRIDHPAIGDGGFSYSVPGRSGSGARDMMFWRKATPADLSRVEVVKVTVPLTRGNPDQQPFTLVAVGNCVVLPITAPPTVRVYADQEALEAARVLLRPGRERGLGTRLAIAKAGNAGLAGTIDNTVRTYTRFYAQLFFKDPEGAERAFPKDMPVKVVLGDHPTGAIEVLVEDDGKITLEMIGYAEVIAHRGLKLCFGSSINNFVLCELPGATASQAIGSEPAEIGDAASYDKRFFNWPREWWLRQADWTVTNDDGRWDAPNGLFKMTRDGRPASLGSKTAPVKLVLDPHWQYLKFEFFDRTYGTTDHAGARKTVPPMLIVANREKSTVVAFDAGILSHWWIESGDAAIQCVPWVIQRKLNGDADSRPSAASILRFSFGPQVCVESTSATARRRVKATPTQLLPGPARLTFYDLPEDWQSRNYYAALSTTAGEFGWFETVAAKPTTAAKPLVFCLDDVVLTDHEGRRLPNWDHSERCAIFVNTFNTAQGCSAEGVYDPDPDAPWFTKEVDATAPEATHNYIVKQPTWVRLIAAQGNLFDVFGQRSKPSARFNPSADVIGARAAVRWVDTTARMGATVVWEPHKGFFSSADRATSDNKVVPTRYFVGGRPALTKQDSMAVQPYFGQHYTPRGGKYTDDTARSGLIGRYDMALLRCCATEVVSGNPTEIAMHVHFQRTHFDFADTPAVGKEVFARSYFRNVLDRWNGVSPALGRPELVPQDTAKRLLVRVVDFIQVLPEAQAHQKLTIKAPGEKSRDWRSAHGTGLTSSTGQADSGTNNGFASAHEHGHEKGMPDEYNERWDGASYGQLSYKQNLPGDPYEFDGRIVEFAEKDAPMMNGNQTLHNRYFWPSAEWVRRAVGFPFKVKLGTNLEYKVPPHADADRSYAFWPLTGVNDHSLPAIAPLKANRGRVNAFLYAVGADDFAVKTMPKLEKRSSTTPYDGIAVFTVLLRVNAWSMADSDMKLLVQALAKVVQNQGTRKLNHRWYLTGTARHGTPQAWTFARCLLYFSPRFLVSTSPELPTRAELTVTLGTFATVPIAVAKLSLLDDYHAVTWADPLKTTRLNAVKAAAVEPASNIRGTWDADSVITGQVPPPAFAGFTLQLAAYEGLAKTDERARFTAIQKFKNDVRRWATDPANATSPFLSAAVGLADRAAAHHLVLGAIWDLRNLEEGAAAIANRRGEHEDRVDSIQREHGSHFVVNCKKDATRSASWFRFPSTGDLMAADDWVASLNSSIQTNTDVLALKAKLATYKSAPELDLAARITALIALKGPATLPAIPSPRGDWDTASVIAGKPRPAEFGAIDSALATAESSTSADFRDQAKKFIAVSTRVSEAISAPGIDHEYEDAANDLVGRISSLSMDPLQAMIAVRALEERADNLQPYLERAVSSRELTLSANTQADFEDELLKAFPSMLGIYKSADLITADDLKPLLAPLGLTSADVHAI